MDSSATRSCQFWRCPYRDPQTLQACDETSPRKYNIQRHFQRRHGHVPYQEPIRGVNQSITQTRAPSARRDRTRPSNPLFTPSTSASGEDASIAEPASNTASLRTSDATPFGGTAPGPPPASGRVDLTLAASVDTAASTPPIEGRATTTPGPRPPPPCVALKISKEGQI